MDKTDLDAVVSALKTQFPGMTMTVLGGTEVGEIEQLALNLHKALAALIDDNNNVIIAPSPTGVSVRVEDPEKITVYFLPQLRIADFNERLKGTYEPLERANALNSNKMYLVGVAVERVLRDNYLVFEGPKTEVM